MKYTIQIVGVGGQGVLLASMVLGNAAMNRGSVLSTVRFGDEVISPLEADGCADLIMGFEPAETVRNMPLGNRDTAVLMNLDPVYPSMVAAGFEKYPEIDDLIKSVEDVNPNLVTLDATKLAIEAGKAVAANAVMIGAVAAMKDFPLMKEDLLEALKAQVPPKFLDLNVRAFEMGYNAVKN